MSSGDWLAVLGAGVAATGVVLVVWGLVQLAVARRRDAPIGRHRVDDKRRDPRDY